MRTLMCEPSEPSTPLEEVDTPRRSGSSVNVANEGPRGPLQQGCSLTGSSGPGVGPSRTEAGRAEWPSQYHRAEERTSGPRSGVVTDDALVALEAPNTTHI